MKKTLSALAVGFMTLPLFFACSGDDTSDDELNRWVDTTRVPARHVSLVYMIAENSLNSNAATDLSEMRYGATNIPEDGRLYVFQDRRYKNSMLLEIRNTQKIDTLYTWDENLNSADTEVMREVLDIVDRVAPTASSWSLTMWSHGSGWMDDTHATRSIGYDTGGPVKEINIGDLASVLEDWHHLDFLFFDACFMQCIELDYALRNRADYILASPAEIPGAGAPYDAILGDIFATPSPDVDGLLQHYYKNSDDGVILSACETAYMEALMRATKPFMKMYFGTEDVTPTYQGVQRYYPSTTYPPFYDLRSFLYKQSPEGLEEWDDVFLKAFPYRYTTGYWNTNYSGENVYYGWSGRIYKMTDEENYGGVSFFTPSMTSTWMDSFRNTDWFIDMGWEEWGW